MGNHVGEKWNPWTLFQRTALSIALIGILAAQVRAQSSVPMVRPKFDAASIKPNNSGRQATFLRRLPGGLYRAENASLRTLIASAYVDGFPPRTRLVFGGPAWIDKLHFEIEARAEGNPGNEQLRLMLQSLLEDRFKLLLHNETRQLPVYALVLSKAGKTGPQLTPHSDDAKCTDPVAGKPPPQPSPGEPMPAYCGGFFMSARPGALRETGNRITMDMLVSFLSQSVDRTLVNRTPLSGVFDFTLEFAPELGPGSQPGSGTSAPDSTAAPSLFTALQEQLGLKLESTKGRVDVVVIDHVEEPSAN
jgi:uncharacterized protein (TIGR03435 family)